MQDAEANPLDAFLAAQQAEGRYFDTSSFTINSVKALQKLSVHQLPDSGFWLVKLVQAAVAARAEEVKVTFGRRLVSVTFLPRTPWQADEVLEIVLSGALPQERALSHLVTGIRASSASMTEAVTWSCGSVRVALSGTSCQVTNQPENSLFTLEATRPARSRSLSHTLATSVTQLVKQTVEENEALRSRCWVCPIPITVDGSPLERGYDLSHGGHIERSPVKVLRAYEKRHNAYLDICMGVMPVADPRLGPPLPYLTARSGFQEAIASGDPSTPGEEAADSAAEEEVEVNKPVFLHHTFLRWKDCGQPVHAALAINAGENARDPKLHFVLDGAVVAIHTLEAWRFVPTGFLSKLMGQRTVLGLRAMVAVEPEALDLSQFAVRGLDLERYVRLLSPHAETLLAVVQKHLGSFYFVPMARKWAPAAGVGMGAQVALLSVISNGVLLLPTVGIIAAATAINTASWRGQLKRCLKELSETIRPHLTADS